MIYPQNHVNMTFMKLKNRVAKPEIMSPVGYWPQLYAAIEAGADAVYFGLKHFTARAKVGFSITELPEVMRTLHQRGVKGYVTFNTLVFDHELSEAAKSLAAIAAAGADAIIVQDIGIAQLAQQIAPQLEIHGSTQMSITNAQGIAWAQKFGVRRVVLARELSLPEVQEIREQSSCELEMFVHGALCVSYSGQCFSSEAWGGRSANRGQCAQACRLPYEMVVDQKVKPLADARYLLSPGDLYTIHHMPEIVQVGISALKIEGRYKDADYVALTTRAYRRAVDEAYAEEPLTLSENEEIQLEQVYSRGLGDHFIGGTNHQLVVLGRSPRHRGVKMGRVTQVLNESVIIEPTSKHQLSPLKAGDGVVFDAADWRNPQEDEEGGRIYQVKTWHNGHLELRFGKDNIDFSRIRIGDLLWRTHDPDLDKEVRPYLQATTPLHKQPVNIHVIAHEDAPLILAWQLVNRPDIKVTVTSAQPLSKAQKRAMSLELLQEQLGRLGNTAYQLAEVTLEIEGQPFAPTSLLNDLRRDAVEQLIALQSQVPKIEVNEPEQVLNSVLAGVKKYQSKEPLIIPQLHIMVRTPEQLEAAIDLRPASITLDYLDLYGLKPAVEQVQANAITARVASPRILKPGEGRIVDFLLKLNCQIVARSNGLLAALQDSEHPALIGDFSLNAANQISANIFLQFGLMRLTPTYDLNAAQIAALATKIGAEKIEVVAYQHLPVFHTEHCVFARFLSDGISYKDCGQPCEKHRVALRDQHGREHPVMADVGCRNTVFGAQAQDASKFLDQWLTSGIRHFRLEFVHESAQQVVAITNLFQDALLNRMTKDELHKQLLKVSPQGITDGSFFVPEDYLSLPLL